jgi:5-formyltetrahydrofolate cyclo-ligase
MAVPRPPREPTSPDPVAERKRALRSRIRAQRRARTVRQRTTDAGTIAVALLALPELAGTTRVAAYVSTATEPGTAPLRAALRARGIQVLLPVALPDGILDWALDTGRTRPGPGPGGAEPDGPRLGADAIRTAEALIVPALAVDTCGNRLGQGGGYYDRVVTRLPRGPGTTRTPGPPHRDGADRNTPPESTDRRIPPEETGRRIPVIAVVHADELLDAATDPVPAAGHDLRVDVVVTPAGTHRPG